MHETRDVAYFDALDTFELYFICVWSDDLLSVKDHILYVVLENSLIFCVTCL